MRMGIDEIYNYLHNHPAHKVSEHIRAHADDVENSLYLLGKILEVKDIYADELSAGVPFMRLFNRHLFSGKSLPELPALPQRARNLTKALARFVVSGMPLATRAEAERKLAICETNVCGYFDGSVCRHSRCGCFAKIKSFFESEHCPIGRW